MGGLRHDRIARTARPTALGSAVATLLAALFICLGGPADVHPDSGTAHSRGPGFTASPGPDTRTAAGTGAATEFTCPYDRGDCGLFPHLTPAVLTAPPQDGPVDTAGLVSGPATARPAARLSRAGALPRAPDLHVLQVLRT